MVGIVAARVSARSVAVHPVASRTHVRAARGGRSVRVLGVDPGLTRCGVGVVEGLPGRTCRLVAVDVVRTDPEADLAARLLALDVALAAMVALYEPDTVAVERVFSQH